METRPAPDSRNYGGITGGITVTGITVTVYSTHLIVNCSDSALNERVMANPPPAVPLRFARKRPLCSCAALQPG